MRTVNSIVTACALVCACTPHDDPTDPPGERVDVAPTVVQEAEPAIPIPDVVAPPLPELAPARPLANLTPVWTQLTGTPASMIHAVGRAPVAMSASDAATLGLTGPSSDLAGLAGLEPVEVAGPLLLLRKFDQFSALELGTQAVRWSSSNGRSYAQFVTPRVFVAEFYGSDVDHVAAWALADGREVWRRTGGGGEIFARIRAMSADETRGYMMHDDSLEAFDPDTGATLWTYPVAEMGCGATSGEDKVVLERPHEFVVLDADTGKPLGQIPTPNKQECAWESYDRYIAPPVIANGRLHVLEGDQADLGSDRALRVIELDDFTEVWRAKGFDGDLLVVDHDAVYLSREAILLALDAETGKVQTELSIGMPFDARVEPVGGAAGPFVIIEAENGSTWILGRGETPPTFEDFEIRGQLSSDYLEPRKLAGVRVRVAGKEVETDKRGRFVVRGRARGAVQVHTPSRAYDGASDEWSWIEFEATQVVLDGSGKYDLGLIDTWEASMS